MRKFQGGRDALNRFLGIFEFRATAEFDGETSGKAELSVNTLLVALAVGVIVVLAVWG